MKKLAAALALTASMAVAGVCSAAGEGAALTKETKAAETFFGGLNGVETVTYAQTAATLDAQMKEKFTAEVFAEKQKEVKTKLGNIKESRFRSFERFDNGDRVVYLGKYSKQENVVMIVFFNPAGKIQDFGMHPVQQPTQPAQPDKK